MFKAKITAAEATFGKGLFDSQLDKYQGKDPKQNAWLIICMRVHVDFVDPASSSTKIVHKGGKDYVKDWDNWLYPVQSWLEDHKKTFTDGFQGRGEKFWNARFYLLTPAAYTDLDIDGRRPNVMCLFRLQLVKKTESPHRTISVYNIKVKAGDEITHLDGTRKKTISALDSYAFRSDASNYDFYDTVKPAADVGTFEDKACKCIVKVKKDTIAHELGHALGQAHIAGLKGDTDCDIGSAKVGEDKCYGTGEDALNVMGRGELVTTVNAISWQKRMAEHTGIAWDRWVASLGYIAPKPLSK
jgi:hypothetical protein